MPESSREKRAPSTKARQMREYRERLVARGLCVRCRNPHVGTHSICGNCKAELAAYKQERYQARQCAGLCVRCGRAATDGSDFCEEHRERRNGAQRQRYRKRSAGIRRKRCSVCNSPHHTARICPAQSLGVCECGGAKDAKAKACEACEAMELPKHPAVQALATLGRATMEDIAAAAGMKRNTAEVALYRYRTAGIVETLSDDEHDLAETLWRVAR